jgi:hypothetical protein
MLVIHWAKHNKTSLILKSGIRPSSRNSRDGEQNLKGVYVYPFSRIKTLSSNWKSNLKVWDNRLGNYNGFIFKLNPSDFPLYAGYWFFNRSNYSKSLIIDQKALSDLYRDFFNGNIIEKTENGIPFNWTDFEIIIPRRISSKRIIKVIKDREKYRPNNALKRTGGRIA